MLEFIKFFVYIVSTLAQLLVLCWHGDRLIELVRSRRGGGDYSLNYWRFFFQSTKTGIEIYKCGWEGAEFDVPMKKSLINILVRSKKPIKMTAFKFSVLSLESFTKILSTSASYFALLRTMVEDD